MMMKVGVWCVGVHLYRVHDSTSVCVCVWGGGGGVHHSTSVRGGSTGACGYMMYVCVHL